MLMWLHVVSLQSVLHGVRHVGSGSLQEPLGALLQVSPLQRGAEDITVHGLYCSLFTRLGKVYVMLKGVLTFR